MHYQGILLLLNITILIMVYFFCREKPKQRKLLFATTIYAYVLAAPLPRLLVWIPFKWIAIFYAAEIGLAFIVLYLILYNYEDIKAAKAKKKQDNKNTEETENQAGRKPCGTVLNKENPVLETPAAPKVSDAKKNVSLKDKVSNDAVEIAKETAAVEKAAQNINDAKEPALEEKVSINTVEPVNPEEPTPIEEPVQDGDNAEEPARINEVHIDPVDRIDLTEPVLIEPPEELNSAEEPACEDKDLSETVEPVHPKEPAITNEPAEEPNSPQAPETLDNEQTDESGEHSIEESNHDDDLDIEQLINKAFDAKCRDDYPVAIQIFEQLLEQNLPEEMTALIMDDIEVMRKKIS